MFPGHNPMLFQLFEMFMNIYSSVKSKLNLFKALKDELNDQRSAGREVTVLPDDTWLVSYPKSGNTWVRFIVANLIHQTIDVGFDNIEELAPDIYQHSNFYLKSIQTPRYLKSHEYFDPRYNKTILVTRDPRDVVVSYYFYCIKIGFIDKSSTISDFVNSFVNGEIDNFGSWGENVGSWLGAQCPGNERLLMRYEDLLTDTQNIIQQIADFIGVEVSPLILKNVEHQCSAERMRDLEVKQSALWKPMRNAEGSMSFVRQYKSNAWKSELNEELCERITFKWYLQMKLLGYL